MSMLVTLCGCPGELDLSGVEDRSSWSTGGEGGAENTSSSAECAAWADGDTVALYTFDDDQESSVTVTDVAGQLHGEIVDNGNGGAPARIDGKAGCGKALAFSGHGHVVVPSTAALEGLDEGTVDFWLRIDADGGGEQGILSRDAANQRKPGHLTILVTPDRRVRVRLQESSDNGGVSHEAVSEKVEASEWHHVTVCFGPPELALYIDGDPHATAATSIGIAGNDNPLVLGGVSWASDEGKADPVELPLHGALDSVRISAVRRDYSP